MERHWEYFIIKIVNSSPQLICNFTVMPTADPRELFSPQLYKTNCKVYMIKKDL